MLEFVELLLDLCDNIIDQLILLKQFKHNKEVKKYIKTLEKSNLSPYERYCIDKYFYGLDVKEEKIPDFYYPKFSTYGNKYINKLIGDIPDIKGQVIKLKEHKDNAKVIDYVEQTFPYFMEMYPYARNIILSYYYDVPYLDLSPSPKSLHITLIKISFEKLVQKQEKNKNKIFRKKFRWLKVGDKIVLNNGPFNGIECVILEKNSKFVKVEMDLFGDKVPYELDYQTKFKKVGKK